MPYSSMLMLYAANISTLVRRREDISQKFFYDITQPSSCLLQENNLSFHGLGLSKSLHTY